MSSFTLFPLQSNAWQKSTGILLVLLLIVRLMVNSSLLDLSMLFTELNAKDLIDLIIVGSLFIFSFSKEKIEDERVHRLRYKSLTGTFIFVMATIIVFAFSQILSGELALFSENILIIPFTALIAFQIVFRFLLWKDPESAYNDGSASDNLSTKQAIIPLLIGFVLLILSALI